MCGPLALGGLNLSLSGMSPENDARIDAPRSPLTPALALPHEIGGYRIIRLLGEGGMGVVYLAEQHDPVHREVALKVLRAGANTEEIIARFEAERQVLALMEHPNITRVYDAGATESGLPYFAMERVIGFPITDYATTRRLTPRDRVRLVVQVCRAVQHAHQKGIIHRDIKPSNVMVMETDGEPVVKIIDFGIAKATAPTAGSAKLTRTGMVIGTPAYMSPEQLMGEGKDVDTRSDVYAIGVLLYELIAGILPHGAAAEAGFRALLDRHASGEVPAPSTQYAALELSKREALAQQRQTDPDALHRMMVGDLDCVILKSLDGERDRRYQSASAFAEDLEHYLAFEPVSARPTSATYRARKFVRRHRTGVAFAGTLLALLVVVAIGATLQARRLAGANARLAVANQMARARQGQAEELIDFMLGNLRSRLTPIGKLDLLDEVGQRALAYFAAVPASALSDDEQFRHATAVQQLGNVRLDQGNLPEAAKLMQRSIALMTPLAVRDSLNPKWQLALAHNQFWAGQIDMRRGDVDAALAHFEPLVRVSDRLMARYPDSVAYRAEVAYALNNIGFVHEAKADARAALASYQAAAVILTPLVKEDTNTDYVVALGAVHNAAGVAQRKIGDLAGARSEHEQELAIKVALARRDTTNRQWQRAVAVALHYLSDIRLWTGDVDGALAQLREARILSASLVAHDTTNVGWLIALANNCRRTAQLHLERNDAAAALRELDEGRGVLARVARLTGVNTPNPSYGREVIAAGTARARALMGLGRAAEAHRVIDDAVALGEHLLTAQAKDLELRRLLADAYIADGELLSRPGSASGATMPLARALVLVDSLARTTRETEFLVLQSRAMLRLNGATEARPVVTELLRRGYRRPSFLELARSRGVAIT